MDPHELMTAREAAAHMGQRVDSVRRLLRAGRLPGRRVGGRWLIERQALLRHLAGGREGKIEDRSLDSQRVLDQGTLLAAMTMAIAGEEDLGRILQIALHHVGHAIAFTGGSIVLVEEERLVARAAVGPFADRVLHSSLPRGQGRLWQVIETATPFLSRDLPAEGFQPTTPIRSYLAVPLVRGDQIFGVLEIDSTEPGKFDLPDQAFLQKVARLLGGPIELANRYAREVQAAREAEAAKRQLTIQYTVSRVLAESLRFEDAVPLILEAIGTHLGWEVGMLWCPGQGERWLECQTLWCAPTIDPRRFEMVSRTTIFEPGVGLPGRVWSSQEPTWIPDLQRDMNFPRLESAVQEGLRGAFAFPLQGDGGFYGVIEFFSRQPKPRDEAVLRMMGAIGEQIGQYLGRRRAEAAVMQSEARHGALLDVALDAIVTIDHEGSIREWNPVAERIFGYSREEAVGQALADLIIPPSLRQLHWQGLERYMTTGDGSIIGRRIEVSAVRADGSEFPVELSITRLPSDGPPLFTGFLRDITHQRRTESRLRFLAEASSKLAASLDYEKTLVNVTRVVVPELCDWCVIDMLEEDGSLRLLEAYHWDEAKRADVHELRRRYPPNPDAPQGIYHVLRSGKSVLMEEVNDEFLRRVARSTEHLELIRELQLHSLMIVPLLARGRTLGAITMASSESRRRYEAEDLTLAMELAHRAALAVDNARLYQEAQEAVRIRDHFLSVASHELKTPITSMLGYAVLLQRRAARASNRDMREQRSIQIIHEEAGRLKRMIDLLLDISRLRSNHLELEWEFLDFVILVERLISVIQPTVEHHSIELIRPDEPLPVRADPLRLEQVLQNLIGNALKYSPAGTTVTVRLGRQGTKAQLSVSDEGIGIPQEALAQLYDRFYRASNASSNGISGLGLGLYLAKEIITQHGGTIEVESREGIGSTFTVSLPLQHPKM